MEFRECAGVGRRISADMEARWQIKFHTCISACVAIGESFCIKTPRKHAKYAYTTNSRDDKFQHTRILNPEKHTASMF